MEPSERGVAEQSWRAWVVLALCFLVLFMALGIRMSFGAFVKGWETAFGATRSDVSVISSVSLMIYGFGMPIVGSLADRFGARLVLAVSMVLIGLGLIGSYFATALWHLVVFYGLVSSVGLCGASSVTIAVAVLKWFPHRRAFALGITSCGIAAGQMILGPVSLFLVRALGWRETILSYGLTCLLALSAIIWTFFRDAPAEAGIERTPEENLGSTPQGEGEGRSLAGMGAVMALFVIAPYFVCGFTDLGFFATHFIPLAQGRGFDPAVVAWAVGFEAAANLLGSLLTGHLADRIRLTSLLGTIYFIRACAFFVLLGAHSPNGLLLYAVMNGAVEAASIAPTAALCAKTWGQARVGSVFGAVSAFHQFGAAAGAYLVGRMYSGTGSYSSAVMLCGVLLLGAGALAWGTRWIPGRPSYRVPSAEPAIEQA